MSKFVFVTGAGISAPSGIPTFAEMWKDFNVDAVAYLNGLQKNPKHVISFWESLRQDVLEAKPNAAHFAIAELQINHDVTIITSNVDDLHERAGSANVIHLHGDLLHVKSMDGLDRKFIGLDPNTISENMRHDIVLYGEQIRHYEIAKQIILSDDVDFLIVVGTRADTFHVNKLLKVSRFSTKKIYCRYQSNSFVWVYKNQRKCRCCTP